MTDQTYKPAIGAIVRATHCQSCGSTDPENVGWDALRRGDGYTACCNERAIYSGTDVFGRPVRCGEDCYHGTAEVERS